MHDHAASLTSHNPVDHKALHQLANKITDLPLLPQVLVKILQLSPSANDYFEQFEKLASEDPPFAVRIISLANSASSAPIDPITTISAAITRMGITTISNLVSSLVVQQVFMPTKPNQIRLWSHSINVAIATRYAALLMSELRIDHGQAYLAGLLHDIGRFVMLEHAEPNLLRVDENHWNSPEQLIEADLNTYKFTHSELGYLAAKKWGLPIIIADVIRSHHRPIETSEDNPELAALTACVQAADRLCVMLIENESFQEMNDEEKEVHIAEYCAQTECQKELQLFRKLLPNLDRIKIESEELFAGLGFAS